MLPYERRSTFGPRTVKRLFAGKFGLAAGLDWRLDAEAGDARCELRGELPRPLAQRALTAAGHDADLADGARVDHRYEQRCHGAPLTTNGADAKNAPAVRGARSAKTETAGVGQADDR
jgi:hypothetical protein